MDPRSLTRLASMGGKVTPMDHWHTHRCPTRLHERKKQVRMDLAIDESGGTPRPRFGRLRATGSPARRIWNLPPDAVSYLEPERVSTFQIEEGVVYRFVRSASQPWSVHLIEVDALRCELGFRVVRAGGAEGRIEVTEMARRSEPGVIAAINGDFFTPEDLPLGVEVSEGQLRGRTSRPVFAWRPGVLPWVGPVEWGEDSLRLGSWTVTERGPNHGALVVAGFPSLLEGRYACW